MYGKIYMTIRSVFSSDRPPMSQIVENVRYLNVEEFFKKNPGCGSTRRRLPKCKPFNRETDLTDKRRVKHNLEVK